MSTPEQDRLIDQVVHAMQTMTGPQMAHRLTPFVSKDINFHDPRLSAHGIDGLTEAMRGLFAGTEGITTRITDRAWGQDGQTVYLRWDRLLRFPGGATHGYTGVCEIMIGMDGKVAAIVDHWDAADHVMPRGRGLLGRLLNR